MDSIEIPILLVLFVILIIFIAIVAGLVLVRNAILSRIMSDPFSHNTSPYTLATSAPIQNMFGKAQSQESPLGAVDESKLPPVPAHPQQASQQEPTVAPTAGTPPPQAAQNNPSTIPSGVKS